MSTSEQPSEEELRAAYEAELQRLRIEQVLLESVVSLVNLGMRRTGLTPGTEGEREPAQVQLAIESVRALVPVIERVLPEQAGPIRGALSQLQLAYVKIGGRVPADADAAPPSSEQARSAGEQGSPEPEPEPDPGTAPAADPPAPGEPGPAQRSGRLWVPGQ